jgi:peroxiredoxin
MVDIITPTSGDYTVDSGVDFAEALKSHKKAVLFAVPGAFTPTCSEKHLPGFIALAGDMKAKGVDAVYCLSVNDKFVMKSWGQGTTGFAESGIKLVADGNGDYTKAIDLVKDATGGRMGLRCTRFAAILEDGVFKAVEVDEAGLEKSSAEAILGML